MTEDNPLKKFYSCKRKRDTVLEQEDHAGHLVGGKRHRGSGSSRWKKSDASGEDWQVECKQTSKQSLGLKLDWLEKITAEARANGKDPMLHVEFLTALDVNRKWVMIPENVFKKLLARE